MNGAELSCGTALKVEPSDPLYKLRRKKESDNHYGPGSQSTLPTKVPEEAEKTEDLDDFFASLDDDDPKEGQNTEESTNEESSAPNKTGDKDQDDLDGFFESLA
jgi:hypothetical protein